MILVIEFIVGPRHVLRWPFGVEVDAATAVVRTVRLAQAYGFMLKSALPRFFVIDGVENRSSKVASLLLLLVVNSSPSNVGGIYVFRACDCQCLGPKDDIEVKAVWPAIQARPGEHQAVNGPIFSHGGVQA